MSDQTTRALVLRQFAALLREGLPASVALERLSEGLSEGAVRTDCVVAARALAAGAAHSGSDFTRLVTDATVTPEQAESLAEAFEAQLDAADALASPTFLLQLVLCGPPVLLAVLGWVFTGTLMELSGDTRLPGATEALIDLATSMRFVGVPLAAGLFFAVRASSARFSPGVAAFNRAARALQASSRPEASLNDADLGLAGLEYRLLYSLRLQLGAGPALRALAAELRREGRVAVATFRSLAPVLALLVVVQIYLAVLIALYLPIFSIAGAVK